MGGDLCSKGHGFESRHLYTGWSQHLFMHICCKNCNVVWKDENKPKRGRGWPIFWEKNFKPPGIDPSSGRKNLCENNYKQRNNFSSKMQKDKKEWFSTHLNFRNHFGIWGLWIRESSRRSQNSGRERFDSKIEDSKVDFHFRPRAVSRPLLDPPWTRHPGTNNMELFGHNTSIRTCENAVDGILSNSRHFWHAKQSNRFYCFLRSTSEWCLTDDKT